MLSTAREEDGIFIGINKVVARAISSSPSIYPCPIQNRYDCPYDNKEEEEQKVTKPIIDVNQLFQLSKIAFLVELAFATAEKDRSKVQIKNRKDVFIAH